MVSSDSGYKPVAGSCEDNKEFLASTKCWEFFE
jgi:hypothetical protein